MLHLLIIIQIASFGIQNRRSVAYGTTERVVHRHMPVGCTIHTPRTAHVVLRIRQRTNQRNASFFLQRQQLAIVFQQDEGFRGNLPGSLAVCLREQLLLCPQRITVFIWILKQAQLILGLQYPAASLINAFLRHSLCLQRSFQGMQKAMCYHIHVRSRIQGPGRSFLHIGHSMTFHLSDGIVVRHHETLESPLVPQQIGEQPLVGRSRHTVDGIERAHH